MAAETGFLIDGTIYEVPGLETFTMDEAQTLYDYSGLTLEDFSVAEEDEQADRDSKMHNPGFMRALMHIAYQREHRDLKPAKVKQLIGTVNMVDAFETLADSDEVDESPLALTTKPEKQSESGLVTSSESSGQDSSESSDPPDSPQTPIGTGGSDTLFQPPRRITSVG